MNQKSDYGKQSGGTFVGYIGYRRQVLVSVDVINSAFSLLPLRLTMISHASTSSDLPDKKHFTNFWRVINSGELQGKGLAKLAHAQGLTRVGVITAI
jgi:hypothetical protein